MRVVSVSSYDDDLVPSWHRLRVAAGAVDEPDEPTPVIEACREAFAPNPFHERVLFLAAERDAVVGSVLFSLPADDNAHLVDVDELTVHPQARRRGIGTQLLAAPAERARDNGRTTMAGYVRRGSPGEPFAAALGARAVVTELRNLLTLGEHPVPAAPVATGYSLVRWVDHCPPKYVESFAVAKTGMADTPIGEMDLAPLRWSAARVRAAEQASAVTKIRYQLCARHDATGELAGLTELFVPRYDHPRAEQGDTSVLPAHRGHGLGLTMKAEMLRWVPPLHPGIRAVDTWNAESNDPMLAINRALGFETVARWAAWQAELADLRA